MSDAYVPMPNTCHPFYDTQAAGIRSMLDRTAVVVAEARGLSAAFTAEETSSNPVGDVTCERRTLEVRKVAGPAPFVGDPLLCRGWYEWRAAIDALGRHVAGPATLHIERDWGARHAGE